MKEVESSDKVTVIIQNLQQYLVMSQSIQNINARHELQNQLNQLIEQNRNGTVTLEEQESSQSLERVDELEDTGHVQ